MTKKAHRAPGGGLNEAGRRHFERRDGGNLLRPIKKGTSPRRVSSAVRFGGMKGKERNPTERKRPPLWRCKCEALEARNLRVTLQRDTGKHRS